MFIVNFEIEYKTSYGQTLFIMGDIGEMGHWKHLLLELKWSEGNIWRARVKISQPVFLYKYVVVDENDQIIRWELGYNRIGDLDIAEIQGLYIDGEYNFHDVNFSYSFRNGGGSRWSSKLSTLSRMRPSLSSELQRP